MQIQDTGVYIFTKQKKQRELDRDRSTEAHRIFTQHAPWLLSSSIYILFIFRKEIYA